MSWRTKAAGRRLLGGFRKPLSGSVVGRGPGWGRVGGCGGEGALEGAVHRELGKRERRREERNRSRNSNKYYKWGL